MRSREQVQMPPIIRRQPDVRRDVSVIAAPDRMAMPLSQGRIHGPMLVTTIIMICYGLVMLFSASMSDGYANKDGNPMYYVLKQASITGAGLILALIIALFFSVRFFDKLWMTVGLYGMTTALLLLVKIMGSTTNGGQRWLAFGPLRFQPSELAKLAAVFCFAGYTSWVRRRRAAGKIRARCAARQFILDGFVDILFPGFALMLWVGLILWQPHLSGAVIMCFIILTVFLSSGIRFRSFLSGFTMVLVLLLIIALLAVTVLPAVMSQDKLKEMVQENFAHVEKRINTFLNPEEASSDDLLQINQSIIAIGSGGLTGLGLGEGRQKYNYLPESHNDFVFAIIGEELGFAGTVSVVLLFVLFLIFGVSVAIGAANPFSTILASGYTLLIVVQAFLNIGVTTRMLPTTGISLPFFSYGGTANLFFLLAIGFVLCVSRSGQRPSNRRI
jgi:cell division protein FtsW